MLKKLDDPAQRSLFGEIVETVETRDLIIDLPDGSWEIRLNRPSGKGWRVFDDHRNSHTIWQRLIPVCVGHARRKPIAGTLGEVYLRNHRCITGSLPATMGFLPGHELYTPAIVMPFGLAHEVEPGMLAIRPDAVIAVHLTRLNGAGSKLPDKSKIMIGQGARGLPIVVAPPNYLLGLVITEGIEDALSVHQATGLGAWAAGSKDRLVALADTIPDWMDCVTVRPDDDADGGGRRRAVQLVQAIRNRMVPGPRGELRPMYAELNEDGCI